VLKYFPAALLAVAMTAQSHAQTTTPDDVDWQRYLHVLRTSTLEWLPSQPFLLKADYQLYDLDGNPTVKGTVEESWPTTKSTPIRIYSPSLTVDDQSEQIKTHTRENFLVRQALSSIVRPFPSVTQRKDFNLEEVGQKIGTVQIDCFSLVPPGTTRTPSSVVYCTNPDNQIVDITGAEFVLAREHFRLFRGHEVPIDVMLSYQEKPSISLHITEIDQLQPSTPVAATQKAKNVTAQIPAEVMTGQIIKHKEPKYPFEAKIKRISGIVVLTALITQEGKITGLEVVASPSPLLSKSAVEAVEKWQYRPYMLNGKPVTVETAILVNYSIERN
jgi:TonB family protein